MKKFGTIFSIITTLIAVAAISAQFINLPREPVYPDQAPAIVSQSVLDTRDLVINRKYAEAEKLLRELVRKMPDDPSGYAGLMVVYQIRMLENEEFFLDAEIRDVIQAGRRPLENFKNTAPKNTWYYTLIGASVGIEGIYCLWRDEYVPAGLKGFSAIQFMKKAAELDPQNWEARLGLGLYTYYRGAYASKVPFLPESMDSREAGIAEIELSGARRKYLAETSFIALCRVYFDAGEYDKSKAAADELIAQYPDFMLFYLFAARGLMKAHRFEEALPYYERAFAIAPDLPFSAYQAGVCCENLGRKDNAVEWYGKAARAGNGRKPNKWGELASKKILSRP